jgi:uncharacterized membrane protein YidH (DUF202 family)
MHLAANGIRIVLAGLAAVNWQQLRAAIRRGSYAQPLLLRGGMESLVVLDRAPHCAAPSPIA